MFVLQVCKVQTYNPLIVNDTTFQTHIVSTISRYCSLYFPKETFQ